MNNKENELQNIEIEAILKGTLEEDESLFKSILERANIDTDQLNHVIVKIKTLSISTR